MELGDLELALVRTLREMGEASPREIYKEVRRSRGVAYTSGVAFYLWRRLPYHHAVWHAFVLLGSILHFFAVLLYVIPLTDPAAAST